MHQYMCIILHMCLIVHLRFDGSCNWIDGSLIRFVCSRAKEWEGMCLSTNCNYQSENGHEFVQLAWRHHCE